MRVGPERLRRSRGVYTPPIDGTLWRLTRDGVVTIADDLGSASGAGDASGVVYAPKRSSSRHGSEVAGEGLDRIRTQRQASPDGRASERYLESRAHCSGHASLADRVRDESANGAAERLSWRPATPTPPLNFARPIVGEGLRPLITYELVGMPISHRSERHRRCSGMGICVF